MQVELRSLPDMDGITTIVHRLRMGLAMAFVLRLSHIDYLKYFSSDRNINDEHSTSGPP